MTEQDQGQTDQENPQVGGEAPDRAEEHRVDVPQNQTATPVAEAQAGDAAPVDASTPAQVSEQSTGTAGTDDSASE